MRLWRSAMTKKLQFKSDAFEAIHSAVSDMHRAGTVSKTTLREFDAAWLLVPPKIAPKQIKVGLPLSARIVLPSIQMARCRVQCTVQYRTRGICYDHHCPTRFTP